MGSAIADEEYVEAGAEIVDHADDAWSAEMVVKVKEPIASEYHYLRQDLILFTYLHLAADRPLTEKLLESGITAIAYETVQTADHKLPLLTPMSEVAGRMATQVGAYHLAKHLGGRGILMGGVPGVEPADVAILGGGVVGPTPPRLRWAWAHRSPCSTSTTTGCNIWMMSFWDACRRAPATSTTCYEVVLNVDLVIGAVLIPGGRAPFLVTRDMLPDMRRGAVIVDVAVDQGGCIETTRPTTHSNPTYVIDDVIHYCVANMPGAVPRTSTFALNNQTLPYTLRLADQGLDFVREAEPMLHGLNTHRGQLTYEAVAEAFDLPFVDPEKALA